MSDALPHPAPAGEPAFDLAQTLRAGRRSRDLSQRELADVAGVAASTVARLEAAPSPDVRLSTVQTLFQALGLRLAGLDATTGTELIPHVSQTWRDAAGRHLPAHLEPRPTAGTWMDPPQPEFSYFLNRARRDVWRQLVDPYREYVYREPQRGR